MEFFGVVAMTRETKIGLLVGLAFIIVIGILLSDQLMRSTEPPAAPLANVGDTLRRGTTTPASHNRPAPVAVSSQDASPDNEVPTREEITRRPPPVTFVQIGRGGADGNAGGGNAGNGGGANVVIGAGGQNGNVGGNAGTSNTARTTNAGGDVATRGQNGGGATGQTRTIADVAADMGEALVGADGQPLRARTPIGQTGPAGQGGQTAGGAQRPTQGMTTGMKQYTVEPGDSLSKIALRQMGANTKANREAIIKANPSLQADPDKVVIGQTYNIPPAPGVSAQAQGRVPAPTPQQPAPERTAAPIKAAGAEFWYQVQPGDNLWKIAKEQLGDASTVPAIKELNKANVKNWDVLPAGTKLRMPARPLASVQ
jgi:nucleoid-associated protein YgaU